MSRDAATITLPQGHPAHGTYSGYNHHLCRCFDCCEAARTTHIDRGYRARHNERRRRAR